MKTQIDPSVIASSVVAENKQRFRTRSNSFCSSLAALVALILLVGSTSAQYVPFDQVELLLGTWEGIFSWSDSIFEGGDPDDCFAEEIAHAALFSTGPHAGKVLMWRRNYGCPANVTFRSQLLLFDPAQPENLIRIELEAPLAFDSNVFCSGHSFDRAGHLIIAGGVRFYTPDAAYRIYPENLGRIECATPCLYPEINVTVAGRPFFLAIEAMQIPRYYPTVLALRRQEIAMTCSAMSSMWSGSIVFGGPVTHPPTPVDGNELWECLPFGASTWPCTIMTIPTQGAGHDTYYPTNPADRELYSLHQASGQQPPGIFLDSYPRAFQLSNNDIFVANDVDTNEGTSPQGTAPGDSWVMRFNQTPVNPEDKFWQLWRGRSAAVGQLSNDRYFGSAILIHRLSPDQQDRVLVFGGSQADPDSTPTSPLPSIINKSVQEFKVASSTNPVVQGEWNTKSPMIKGRKNLNAVILPTGEVFLVGGEDRNGAGLVPVTTPELYQPGLSVFDTSSSRLLKHQIVSSDPQTPNATPRTYHSFAVQLLDGRILVAGGEHITSGPYPSGQFTGEIYSPPYLEYLARHGKSRPVIVSCSSAGRLNPDSSDTFTIDLTVMMYDGDTLDRVVLLRPASVTHHFDADQRYIELQVVSDPTPAPGQPHEVTVLCPKEKFAPPGNYMLFAIETGSALNNNRIPSAGRFVTFDQY